MKIGAVAIGRNEAGRLPQCLATLAGQVDRLVYVDSGSTDNSVALAQSSGAHVVELDQDSPFTAARARNAGYKALLATWPDTEFVQFIDADCWVEETWVALAAAHIQSDPKLGIVTGWRRETYPYKSIYNTLCEVEWHRPAGPIVACGGDMMVRCAAFDEVGGFDPTVIAAEDDEFCQRIGKAGWSLERLPEDMTVHDANMLEFRQWWKRAERSGHGFAQVADMHPGYFAPERRRVAVYGAILPVLAVIGWFGSSLLLLGVIGLYALSFWRAMRGLEAEGMDRVNAPKLAGLLTLSKFPNLIGMLRYYLRKKRGRAMRLIEYK